VLVLGCYVVYVYFLSSGARKHESSKAFVDDLEGASEGGKLHTNTIRMTQALRRLLRDGRLKKYNATQRETSCDTELTAPRGAIAFEILIIYTRALGAVSISRDKTSLKAPSITKADAASLMLLTHLSLALSLAGKPTLDGPVCFNGCGEIGCTDPESEEVPFQPHSNPILTPF